MREIADNGHEWKHLRAGLRDLGSHSVDDEAQGNRHEHDLHDGHEHAHVGHIDRLAGEQEHECRGDDRCHDGRARGHADGKRDVALGQVRHDVGGRTAWAAADEHNAHGLSSVGSWKTRQSTHAMSGMMMNCDRMPVITAFGLVNTTLKSESLSVHAHAEHNDAEERVHPTCR